MTNVVPCVFFLGETTMCREGVESWLSHIGGSEAVSCLDHVSGKDLEQLIELMARRCYLSFAPKLNPNVSKVRTDSNEFHKNVIDSRHGSVMAHGHCSFAFENVSRVFTHELVRNSVGNDMSQESLRYVRLTDIKFWTPPVIANETASRYIEPRPPGTSQSPTCGPPLQGVFLTPNDIFQYVVKVCEWGQKALADYYDIDAITSFDCKKKLTSAFRRIAPIGLATGIGMTFNIRSLRWIIEQRTNRAAEEEIRFVFGKVAEIAMTRWPALFQDFSRVDTKDGLLEYVPENSKI